MVVALHAIASKNALRQLADGLDASCAADRGNEVMVG